MLYDPHLDMFLQVARFGSFAKAADANYITPSAVIKQINRLESDLNVRLFHRTHRGLKLTKAGESLLNDAPKLIAMSQEIASHARTAMEQENNVIRIGTSPMTPAEVLIELWPKLSEILPDFKFEMVPYENTPENARDILKNLGQNIDVVAGIFDDVLLSYRECKGFPISEERLCVSFSIMHPLAAKKHLKISDLYGYDLMMIAPHRMACMDALRNDLIKNHPQIKIIDFSFFNTAVFNECQRNNCLMITIERWRNVHPLLKTVAMDWPYTATYGILYAKKPDAKVEQFLNALKKIL